MGASSSRLSPRPVEPVLPVPEARLVGREEAGVAVDVVAPETRRRRGRGGSCRRTVSAAGSSMSRARPSPASVSTWSATRRRRASSAALGAGSSSRRAGVRGTSRADEPDYTTVLMGNVVHADALIDPVVVVAREIHLGGTTTDAAGRPLAYVEVDFELPQDFRHRFADVLDASTAGGLSSSTGEDGRFLLRRVPSVRGAVLRAQRDGYRPVSCAAPTLADDSIGIVLPPLEPESDELLGIVLDAAGEPVERARVALGNQAAVTAADGSFHVPRETYRIDAPVIAAKAGHLPARFEPDRTPEGAPLWPDFLELRLGGPPLSITGRVVDEDGEGLAGIRVWPADATFFGYVGDRATHVEKILRGADEPKEKHHEPPSLGWDYVVTDERGDFELGGLLDRKYMLHALDDRTLLRGELDSAPAGKQGVRIRMPASDVHPLVAGRVRTLDGLPLEGVEVVLVRTVARIEVDRGPGQTASWSNNESGARARTDVEGRFRLNDVPRGDLGLSFGSERIMGTEVRLEEVDDVEQIEVLVTQRCHFEVELDGELAGRGHAQRARGGRRGPCGCTSSAAAAPGARRRWSSWTASRESSPFTRARAPWSSTASAGSSAAIRSSCSRASWSS